MPRRAPSRGWDLGFGFWDLRGQPPRARFAVEPRSEMEHLVSAMANINETGRRRTRKLPFALDPYQASPILVQALHEDLGTGDITTRTFVPQDIGAVGLIRFHEEAVVAGLPLLAMIFSSVDRDLAVQLLAREGDRVSAGTVVAEITGRAAPILTGERVALNFLQRLSGIASLTRLFVERVADTGAKILDTRKTAPGLRYLEKYAVRVGGGINHRTGLWDAVLIKDNHLAIMEHAGIRGELAQRIADLREQMSPAPVIEAEAKTIDEVEELLAADVDIVLLDNMDPQMLMRGMLKIRTHNETARKRAGARGRPRLVLAEASGGVNLETVGAISATGVDRISVGALTHSARAIDISMDLEPATKTARRAGSDTRARRRR